MYPEIAAAVNARLFFNKGRISFVLDKIGANPKIPNSMPHNGDKSARKPIEIN